jgi:hypothetical protein
MRVVGVERRLFTTMTPVRDRRVSGGSAVKRVCSGMNEGEGENEPVSMAHCCKVKSSDKEEVSSSVEANKRPKAEKATHVVLLTPIPDPTTSPTASVLVSSSALRGEKGADRNSL